jgi:hypothetical protein
MLQFLLNFKEFAKVYDGRWQACAAFETVE